MSTNCTFRCSLRNFLLIEAIYMGLLIDLIGLPRNGKYPLFLHFCYMGFSKIDIIIVISFK